MIKVNSIDSCLHSLTISDIPGLIALSDSVGWDYDETEIHTILSIGTAFGHKDASGTLLSSAAIIPYDDNLASIGMVIVHPSSQGKGYGRQLMKACMASVSTDTTIMLIATPEGEPLYKTLGFQTMDRIRKFIAERYEPEAPPQHEANDGLKIAPMEWDDFSSVVELDKAALGSSRSHFLKTRMRQANTCLVAKNRSGKIIGYGFAVQGPVNLIAGPIVAENAVMAEHLLYKLTQHHTGRVRIDVPDEQAAFHAYLEQNGFTQVSHPPVMVANATSLPRRDGTYWAIGAQIYG
ncbi:GNAT family N-acetyltransferase [Brevibacillus formosus]|uniref:GNAT family N-acetyltransferase n=1 Tax=Brevibacillus TaxID=55080 RepID=UPI000D113209|nr:MULTISPECIES: GNAT family N-acetyltransferase [Brevibacillus]MBG9944472.1 acetyltransferase [Brevibacillus formosus]MED1946365.1 GNAT family N-acetyltransferase [Brevibacillus formosus]MED1998713.1 GNAT family N-acetyltransferase [Brevibacillus formosus]MED2084230.1 GNAT family N-acetyltransferase [Brevibacillus formosus]PSK18257.1 GNAT family N-acetyltransferase [Brevibacillus sp. NRRL NRS-603]